MLEGPRGLRLKFVGLDTPASLFKFSDQLTLPSQLWVRQAG